MKRSHLVALASAVVTVATGAASAQGYRVGGPEDRDGPASAPGPSSAAGTGASGDGSTSQGTATVTPSAGGPSAPRPGSPAAPTAPRERAWTEYAGIAPGRADVALLRRWARQRGRRGGPVVAWPGFQLTATGSRVFLVVSSQATVTPVQEAGRRVYRVAGATVPLANNRRALETGAFATPVTRAFLRTTRGAVDLVIELRAADVEPTLSQQAGPDGWSLIVLDFPRWNAPDRAPSDAPPPSGPRTATTRPPTDPAPEAPRGPDPQAAGQDTERPPPPNLR
jgi:hypothetical protein